MSNIVVGTNHFRSLHEAARYYQSQEPTECSWAEAVDSTKQLIADKSIVIGKPAILPGETLRIINGEGRYAIELAPNDPRNKAEEN